MQFNKSGFTLLQGLLRDSNEGLNACRQILDTWSVWPPTHPARQLQMLSAQIAIKSKESWDFIIV